MDYNAPCSKDTGFFFLPVSTAGEMVGYGRCSEMDALLDLWINTVYNDDQVQGSDAGPVVYLRNGTGSPLLGYAELAQRWGGQNNGRAVSLETELFGAYLRFVLPGGARQRHSSEQLPVHHV